MIFRHHNSCQDFFLLSSDQDKTVDKSAINSASGRTILAYLPKDELKVLFRGHRFELYTENSPKNYRQLESKLDKIRINRYYFGVHRLTFFHEIR